MSLYNMLHGVSPITFIVMPMLGKHPNEYPRFRNCFLNDEEHPEYNDHIHIYTRVGGGNRPFNNDEIEEMRKMPTFVTDFDDNFDSTYATYVFAVPEKWKSDFGKIKKNKLNEVSDEYVAQVLKVFPKVTEQIRTLFGRK